MSKMFKAEYEALLLLNYTYSNESLVFPVVPSEFLLNYTYSNESDTTEPLSDVSSSKLHI